MNPPVTLPDSITRHRVFGPADTATFLGVTVRQLRRMRAERLLPRPIYFSERRYGWRIGDLIAWLNDGAPDEIDRNRAEMERTYQRALREAKALDYF